jgi:hypothetical protein
VSKEIHTGGGEHALFQVDKQAMLLKPLQQQPHVAKVVLVGRASHDNVVQIPNKRSRC